MNVAVSDLHKEFGELIAAGVDGFSNVGDSKGTRINFSNEEYCRNILDVDSRHPQLKLPQMKMFADRILNYFDPVRRALTEAELKERRKKFQDPTGPFVQILLADPKYEKDRIMVERACQVAERGIGAQDIDLLEWSRQRLSQGE